MEKHRAICPAAGYKGPWRNSYADALKDANDYMESHPTRIAEVETRLA